MFGERYFTARGRLAGVMAGIGALAAETGTELTDPGELADGLGPPFVFVVCGEVNAGKSALFNGLFGHDLCPMNKLPETKVVAWYQWGPAATEVVVVPLLEERYRPLGFLRDFHLIDTPGINSAVVGHQQITDRLLPVAELVMCVLPVSNPWGAVTWNVISRLPAAVLEKVVLVIQQCDRVDPADIGVILGHMRVLSQQRLGREVPTFAVSAKLAFEAKQGVPVDGRRLAASGFPALEAHLATQVCDSPWRQAKLETWRGQAAAALRAVESQLEKQGKVIGTQAVFLEDEERNIAGMRERFIARLPSHLSGVAEVFQRESVWVGRLLRRQLGVLRSVYRLFVGDPTSHAMETAFIERLQATVEAVAEKDGEEVVAACRQHWNELAERALQVMGVRLGDAVQLDERLMEVRNRFVKRLGRAAREGIGQLKVRNQLGNDLSRRNLSLKSFTLVTLLLVTMAGTCGALAVPVVPLILLAMAGVFGLAGWVIARLSRRVVVTGFQDRLLDTCGGFASALKSDYEEALRIVFQDYGDTLGAIRRHLVAAKGTLEPRQKRWNELFLTLKALEQDLRGSSS
jgi:hypothetical protein